MRHVDFLGEKVSCAVTCKLMCSNDNAKEKRINIRVHFHIKFENTIKNR